MTASCGEVPAAPGVACGKLSEAVSETLGSPRGAVLALDAGDSFSGGELPGGADPCTAHCPGEVIEVRSHMNVTTGQRCCFLDLVENLCAVHVSIMPYIPGEVNYFLRIVCC